MVTILSAVALIFRFFCLGSRVVAFDNVSGLPSWLSDALCRLATGGGFAIRQLYTDGDEILFDARRPVILNGIEDFVSRGDLGDRSIVVGLAAIPDDKRREKKDVLADFEAKQPQVLGALLTAAAVGLRDLSKLSPTGWPRMADFAKWGAACCGGLPWSKEQFLVAFNENRAEIAETVAEGDFVAQAVRQLVARCSGTVGTVDSSCAGSTTRVVWAGTSAELLEALRDGGTVGDGPTSANRFEKVTPRGVAGMLRRSAPGLRRHGIGVEFKREAGGSRTRTIVIVETVQKETTVPIVPDRPGPTEQRRMPWHGYR